MATAKGESILLEGDYAVATLPEGTKRKMKIAEVIGQLAPRLPDTCDAILPDGVKCAIPTRTGVVLVHQTPPQVYGFRWIADDSEEDFGPGTRYRTVRLSLPYAIVLAVYATPRPQMLMLSQRNECYFSNRPIESQGLDTPLHYPALLNCSKMATPDGLPLSWICTQHLSKRETRGHSSLDASLREGLAALLRHLFESGFNRSSEHHEGESGFSASVEAKIDSRIASVEAWEAATRENPLFAIDVPWLPVGKTLRELTARAAGPGRTSRRSAGGSLESAADIARLIFNAPTPTRNSK